MNRLYDHQKSSQLCLAIGDPIWHMGEQLTAPHDKLMYISNEKTNDGV